MPPANSHQINYVRNNRVPFSKYAAYVRLKGYPAGVTNPPSTAASASRKRKTEEIILNWEPPRSLTSEVSSLFNQIKEVCVSGHPDQRMELSVLVYRLLLVLERQRQSFPSKRSLSLLIRKIINDPSRNYSREDMARMLGVNIRTLTKSFQDTVDCAPMQFVIQARMKLAKQLLETETMPIYQVAETCGYQCEAYFSSEFKKHFGCSPREYVKRLG